MITKAEIFFVFKCYWINSSHIKTSIKNWHKSVQLPGCFEIFLLRKALILVHDIKIWGVYFLYHSLEYKVTLEISTNLKKNLLTTPAERTKMSGDRVVESSTTCCMSNTGGSTNLDPRLLTMNEVTQNDTRSGRSERTNNIFWSSLQALSHSPTRQKHTIRLGRDTFAEVNGNKKQYMDV